MAKNKQIELPPIEFEAAGATAEEQRANREGVELTEGYPLMTLMCVDLILRRVDTAVFDFTAQAVPFRYQIDGLWLNQAGMDRGAGDPLLASLKQLAGMNWQDRRNRQEGKFRALFEKKRYEFRVISQGVKSGERVAIHVGRKRDPLETVTDLGMREQMKKRLAEILNGDEGLVVCAAVAGEGFTTCWRAFLAAGDRYMRDYYVLEAAGREEPEVINVNRVTWNPADGQTSFSPVPQLLLKEPNVLAFPELEDGPGLDQMLDLVRQKKLMVITRRPARGSADALGQLIAMKPSLGKLSAALKVMLTMRLVRKLCKGCREAYPPSPQLLARLGFPAGRIRQFWRPKLWRAEDVDEKGNPVPPCELCYGTGYSGRTGVFEMFEVGEGLRKLVAAGESRPERLQEAALNEGQIALMEEMALLAAQGVTSLEEMQRVLAPPKPGV